MGMVGVVVVAVSGGATLLAMGMVGAAGLAAPGGATLLAMGMVGVVVVLAAPVEQ